MALMAALCCFFSPAIFLTFENTEGLLANWRRWVGFRGCRVYAGKATSISSARRIRNISSGRVDGGCVLLCVWVRDTWRRKGGFVLSGDGEDDDEVGEKGEREMAGIVRVGEVGEDVSCGPSF